MIVAGPPVSSARVEKRESGCPYCGSQMSEGTCPRCGSICPRCGTPTKEPTCPQCGHGSFLQGYSPTGSPAPAQSPELSDVQRILGRTPSRREFYMVRGLVDRDKERIHRLTELLCQKLEAPLSRELIEFRALQVLKGASKKGAKLTHGECVIFAFLEAARRSGVVDRALRALAEGQLLDSNLRLGLARVRLSPLKFLVEISGECESSPHLLVDGDRQKCKIALLETSGPRRLYALYWSPLLSECLGQGFGTTRRTVSAEVESDAGSSPLKIAWRDRPGETAESLEVVLDPRRLFYGFSNRKEIEVDIGVPAVEGTAPDSHLMLRAIGKKLDRLEATGVLFREAGGWTPSSRIWSGAQRIMMAPENSQVAVGPRKKASAALIAADMRHFSELDPSTKARLAFALARIPLRKGDEAYACTRGLLIPREFSAVSGTEWNDALTLAVIFLGRIEQG